MRVPPREALERGAKIVQPFLSSKGFSFAFIQQGKGSGGAFAAGEFYKANRRLEFHFRCSLGLVRYHLGDHNASHQFYMKELGVADQCHYPGFSDDFGAQFRGLLHDLELFADDFLIGSGVVLLKAAQREAEVEAKEQAKLMVDAAGDVSDRAKARELFRQRRYADAVQLLEDLRYPELLTAAEVKMLEIARKALLRF